MSAPPISAAETTPPLPACLLVDLLWEAFTEEGAEAFAEERPADAAAAWQVAERLAGAFSSADPRRAASLANLAAAIELAAPLTTEPTAPPTPALPRKGGGSKSPPHDKPLPPPRRGRVGVGVNPASADVNTHALESLYRQALACWAAVPGWVERMTPEREARSSLFHHRMERKHRSAYEDIAREGYRRLADGARAACLGNFAGLLGGLGRGQEAEALYREAIAARALAFGARDAGLMHLCTDLADLLTDAGRTADAEEVRAKAVAVAANSPLTAQRRWASEKPARMSDARKLLAAAYLTPVIHR